MDRSQVGLSMPEGSRGEYARLSHLPQRPPVDISFQDLTYTVPEGRKGSKLILRSLSGEFKSGELTAILGPSGAGKSTLLNVLAGYRCAGSTGTICTNGQTRDLRQFRKLSRYIMQEDLLQPLLTVQEAMCIAADLKLGQDLSHEKKLVVIDEIMQLLRLDGVRKTTTDRLSGGERKRVSIALELVNNPPVIFLDEPTTGLDDLSSSMCVALLKRVAKGGRTVICSVHTPSARLFSRFDHVYVVAAGRCAYQGSASSLVPFLEELSLPCPKTYNPADFVIEVSSGEYGSHLDKMVTAIDNGRCNTWRVHDTENLSLEQSPEIHQLNSGVATEHQYHHSSTPFQQFAVLLKRMMIQNFRNKSYLWLRICLYLFLGAIISSLFWQMGNDASKTIFNFGFCYSCIIVMLYIPLLPMLLAFPTEVQLLKREYFNRWYGLKPYYAALIVSRIPVTLTFSLMFLVMAYTLTGQPMEIARIAMFFSTSLVVALISETMGIIISSTLSVVNSVFTGPAMCVPLMLLAVYGIGYGNAPVPIIWKIGRYFSFMRWGLEGLIVAVYGYSRPDLVCPFEKQYCEYKNPAYFMKMMGMADTSYWLDMLMLLIMLVAHNLAGYFMLRQRLAPSQAYKALRLIGRLVKNHISLSSK